MTFQNNSAPGAFGGAINNGNSPTLIENTLFDGNTAGGGGAVATGAVSLQVIGSIFLNNTGSAICTGGPATIDGSTFTNNTTNSSCGSLGWNGGGAIQAGNDLTVTNSTFYGNRFNGGSGPGGAIALEQGRKLRVSNTYFDSNYSKNEGGAIFAGSATLIIADNDFRFNTACGNGGAIANTNGTTTIDRSLFWANGPSGTCTYGSGGALMLSGGGSATIRNSVFYLNGGTAANSNHGGAVSSQSVTLSIIASTFYNNGVSGWDAQGGNLSAEGGTVFLRNTIIAGGTVNGAANNCSSSWGVRSLRLTTTSPTTTAATS